MTAHEIMEWVASEAAAIGNPHATADELWTAAQQLERAVSEVRALAQARDADEKARTEADIARAAAARVARMARARVAP
jgi:hypothetical protein